MTKAASSEAPLLPTTAKRKYRPEIDGLRAFAVVAVIINHFNKDLLPSGYLGVDIFFVISGYVITSSLAGWQSKNFADFVSGFYERRIKRLVPALVVFVLSTSVLICLFNPDPDLALKTGGASLFGLSNLYLLKQSTNYFAQSTELNPFTHTWSLGVEEQFYLLFPFLIWFSGFGQQAAKGARNLFFWVGALSIASLTSFIYLYQVNQPAAYFLMPPRFWEMAAGCLIFIGFQQRAKIEQALERVPPLLVVVAMVWLMLLPVAAAVPATLGIIVLSAVLIACLKKGTAAYRFFTLDQIVYVGLVSYSLYLWHWGVLCISRWTIGVDWRTVPFQIVLLAVLSSFSYRMVEVPYRRASTGRGGLAVLGMGLAAMTTVFAAIISLTKFHQPLLQIGSKVTGAKTSKSKGILQKQMDCHLPKNSISAIADCLGGTNAAQRSIYIIGDSHASNHYPSIREAVSTFKSRPQVRVLVDWGMINWFYGIDGCGSHHPCIKDAGAKHLDFFKKQVMPGDIVVFSWLRNRIVVEQGSLPRQPDTEKLSILQQKLTKIASTIKSSGGRMVLVDDIPAVCDPGINYQHFVLNLGQYDKCSVPEKISLDDRIGMTRLYQDLVISNPGLFLYFDPHPALCNRNLCTVFDQRSPGPRRMLYADGLGHFFPDYPNPLTTEWRHFFQALVRHESAKS
jgi:peptidoglycan/LPS O-acetylase OafA/YrhL